MVPTIIKAKMGGGFMSKLLGINSDCKGEVEGFSSEELKENPCTNF